MQLRFSSQTRKRPMELSKECSACQQYSAPSPKVVAGEAMGLCSFGFCWVIHGTIFYGTWQCMLIDSCLKNEALKCKTLSMFTNKHCWLNKHCEMDTISVEVWILLNYREVVLYSTQTTYSILQCGTCCKSDQAIYHHMLHRGLTQPE